MPVTTPTDASPMLIGGVDDVAADGGLIDVHDPATPDVVVGRIFAAGPADVDRAVRSARKAFADWREVPIGERVAALSAAADALDAISAEAAEVLTREMGKIVGESFGDIGTGSFFLRILPSPTEQLMASHEVNDDFGHISIARKPLGVVAVIVPWNWPISLLFMRVAAALAGGNTVVCLPSPYASLAVLQAVRAVASALPPGVLNVVTGHGAEAGQALTEHPDVNMVAFVGSTATGQRVLRAAAGSVKRVALELGGNDPAILLDDVTVDDALGRSLLASAFATSGQVCYAAKRVYAPRSIYDQVVQSCIAAASEAVVGNGLDPAVTMGPLVNAAQLSRFQGFVDEAAGRGASVATVGRFAEGTDPSGFFSLPSIVSGLDDTFELVRGEQFGPALPIVAYDDDDDAIARANDSTFGLGASVWASDLDRAKAVGARIESGMVFLNRHDLGVVHPRGLFGGVKQSGLGRQLGPYAIESFTEAVQLVETPVPAS